MATYHCNCGVWTGESTDADLDAAHAYATGQAIPAPPDYSTMDADAAEKALAAFGQWPAAWARRVASKRRYPRDTLVFTIQAIHQHGVERVTAGILSALQAPDSCNYADLGRLEEPANE